MVKPMWVVRTPDRVVLLPPNIRCVRVVDNDDIPKTMPNLWGLGDNQADSISETQQSEHRYWVVVVYDEIEAEFSGELVIVLCGVRNRDVGRRIVHALTLVLFSNTGDNTLVDLTELLTADAAVDIECVDAVVKGSGRFVDLSDNGPPQPVVATRTRVLDTPISIEQLPSRELPVQQPTGSPRGDVNVSVGNAGGALWVPDGSAGVQGTIGPIGGPIGVPGPVGPPGSSGTPETPRDSGQVIGRGVDIATPHSALIDRLVRAERDHLFVNPAAAPAQPVWRPQHRDAAVATPRRTGRAVTLRRTGRAVTLQSEAAISRMLSSDTGFARQYMNVPAPPAEQPPTAGES